VASLNGAVVDTHALVFHAAGTGQLGPRAAEWLDRCERREALVYVPTVVMWEVSLLARASRITLKRSVRSFFEDLFSNPSYQPIEMGMDDVYRAGELTFTRDPFDALICASALTLGVPLITRDALIRSSGTVAIIW